MLDNYNPKVTAINRRRLSVPMRILLDANILSEYSSIIDYGTGKGFDVKYLESLDYNIKGYDKYVPQYQIEDLLYSYYEILTCNYVFNVIADWSEFYETLDEIRNLAKEIYISVRTDIKSVKPNWEYDDYLQGYWTGRSFQRFYTIDMIKEHFGVNTDIMHSDKSFILFKLGEE